MITASQAKQKHCPAFSQGLRPKCIAQDCMAWIMLEPKNQGDEEHGYCGLTKHGPNPHHEH